MRICLLVLGLLFIFAPQNAEARSYNICWKPNGYGERSYDWVCHRRQEHALKASASRYRKNRYTRPRYTNQCYGNNCYRPKVRIKRGVY